MRLWFERGMRAKPPGFELQKMFSPNAFLGYPGRGADMKDRQDNDLQLLAKFYRKYPEVKYFPQGTRLNTGWGGIVEITHPASVFVKKQRQLMNKGYSEQKSFEVVEGELGKSINQHRDELRILRGLAINTYGGQSYLDRFQQVAELESSLKVKRLERDIPKFLRAQNEWVQDLQGQTDSGAQGNGEDKSYQRESIEDMLQEESKKVFSIKANQDPLKEYEPVLYEIVKDPIAAGKEREGFSAMQEGFVERTERLLQIFHQRSHIHDGLKHLSDKEVIRKVREAPTKLKKSAQTLLKKLKKHGVKLDDHAEIDYSQVTDQNIVAEVKKNEALAILTLMQADLEFEYPQKLEKIKIKADVLKLVEEEEAKIKSIAQQREFEELSKKVLTYEEYYGSRPSNETQLVRGTSDVLGDAKRDTKFETFVQQRASKYMFDNDLLEQAYKFWENDEERSERLKKIWLDLRKKNALGGVEARTTDEQDKISEQIVELTRKVRFRVDQELARRNFEPLFKENYRAYDKEEFLLDCDIEFTKIKRLLEKNPKLLKEDPLLGGDYLKIINLIKRKKLAEVTSNEYRAVDSIDSTYHDLDQIDREQQFKKLKEEEKFRKDMAMEQQGTASSDRLQLEDTETETSVRAAKKREERDKNKLLKQFDALAEQYEKSASIIQTHKPTESAGDLKRKSKKKKEKTLASKLRLKEKKGGSDGKK